MRGTRGLWAAARAKGLSEFRSLSAEASAAASEALSSDRTARPMAEAAATAAAAAAAGGGTGGAAAATWQLELVQARRLAWPAGAAAGLVGSVAGAGGATVIVPIVSRFCQTIPQRILAGTSVAAVLATASASTATFAAAGCIDLPASLLLCAPAVALAPLGARWTARLDCSALKRLLGFFLLAAAPLIPLKYYLFSSKAEQQARATCGPAADAARGTAATAAAAAAAGEAGEEQQQQPLGANAAETLPSTPAASSSACQGTWVGQLRQRMPDAPTAAVLLATGGIAGFASGLLGVAPGIIIIPTVALVMPFTQATVLGTSLLAVIPTSAIALLQHHRLGNVDRRMGAALAASSLVGAAAGSQAAVHAPPGALEGVFAVTLLVLARATLKGVRR